ncbi:MAG: hypothetical protein ACKVU1_06145 [bacterium]
MRTRSRLFTFIAAALALGATLAQRAPARASENGLPDAEERALTAVPGSQTLRTRFASDGSFCVRVAVAGVTTRNAPSAGHSTTGGVIQLPAGVTAGSIVWAGLYWVILADETPINSVTLNSELITPIALPVTASPCWPETFAFAYFADVTAYVTAGVNIVAGLDDSGDLGVAPESEGASLVVVYASEDTRAREIIVIDGNDVVRACGDQYDNALPVINGPGVPANLYFIGGDGQSGPAYPAADDNQLWNGAALGDGDDFDASDPATPGAAENIGWDSDAQPAGWAVVTGATNTASVNTLCTGDGDCVNWIATVLEVGIANCGSTPAENRSWGGVKRLFK